jgi:hypothetical protein
MPVDDDDLSEYLNVAVRAWTDSRKDTSKRKQDSSLPTRLLVIDTETTVDENQTLKFGSAQLVSITRTGGKISGGRFRDEVLFHADDLETADPEGYAVLTDYCRTRNLQLIPKSQFMEQWIHYHCVPRMGEDKRLTGTGTLAGFNLPFDMSRLAYHHGDARKRNKGAFTFQVFPDWNGKENKYRPRFICNSLDSKKSLMSWGPIFKGQNHVWENGVKPERGNFLDVKTLIWGMTNRSVSLARGCKLFGLPEQYSKSRAEEHGRITTDYIDYNRQDVTATGHLAIAVLKEFTDHPVKIKAEKIFSPASVSKGYLREMGVTPMLDRETVPQDNTLLGNITSTFYGARAEAHIRNVPVPLTVNDFTSMYCLVNALLEHWQHITAETVQATDVTQEFRGWLSTVTVDTVLDSSQWPAFTGFALIEPNGGILPVRAEYGDEPGYNVGLNRLHSAKPFWYAMPDVIASVLLTRKVPVIRKAIRFIPSKEKISTLKTINLMGMVPVNPAEKDFFREVTEQRAIIKAKRTCGGNDGCACADCKAIEFLKVIGNSGSYGIYVEMLRTDLDKPASTETYGMHEHPWKATVNAVETAQEFCYPPVGSVITSGARLLLAVLERLVTDAGGTWLFCDTDSMAVVCDKPGSLIPCPGSQHRTADGEAAIRALTPKQMEEIRASVNKLNPFNRDAVPSILKDETSKTNATGQVYGFAISAKRYTLFTYVNGKPYIPEKIDGKESYKRHGLGLYLNPMDPSDNPEDRQWIRQTWQYILDKTHGLNPEMPEWSNRPALGRVSLSSPHVMNVLRDYNCGKTYDAQVKPFGFVLMASELPGFMSDKAPRRFISPYSSDPGEWLQQEWYDLHNPGSAPVHITVNPSDDPQCVTVKSMHRVLREYELHPESKSYPPQGNSWNIVGAHGVLSRRTVRIKSIIHIGKESNKLEAVQNHMIDNPEDVYTEYNTADSSIQYHGTNPAIIRQAFEDFPNREIARMVNAESAGLRRNTTGHYKTNGELETPEQSEAIRRKTYGIPVTIDHKVVERFLSGSPVNPENALAIERTAAKHVGQMRGIQDQIGYTRDKINPQLALAQWAETGYTTEIDLINERLQKSGYRQRMVTITRTKKRQK